jgi:hypothetical protein
LNRRVVTVSGSLFISFSLIRLSEVRITLEMTGNFEIPTVVAKSGPLLVCPVDHNGHVRAEHRVLIHAKKRMTSFYHEDAFEFFEGLERKRGRSERFQETFNQLEGILMFQGLKT